MQEVDHLSRQGAVGDQLILEEPKLIARGLVPDQQQKGDLLERRVLRQVMDLVPAVDQRPLLDGADRGVARDDALESAGKRG